MRRGWSRWDITTASVGDLGEHILEGGEVGKGLRVILAVGENDLILLGGDKTTDVGEEGLGGEPRDVGEHTLEVGDSESTSVSSVFTLSGFL